MRKFIHVFILFFTGINVLLVFMSSVPIIWGYANEIFAKLFGVILMSVGISMILINTSESPIAIRILNVILQPILILFSLIVIIYHIQNGYSDAFIEISFCLAIIVLTLFNFRDDLNSLKKKSWNLKRK